MRFHVPRKSMFVFLIALTATTSWALNIPPELKAHRLPADTKITLLKDLRFAGDEMSAILFGGEVSLPDPNRTGACWLRTNVSGANPRVVRAGRTVRVRGANAEPKGLTSILLADEKDALIEITCAGTRGQDGSYAALTLADLVLRAKDFLKFDFPEGALDDEDL